MIKVTRIMEYEYTDNETAQKHMDNWAVPPNGTHRFSERCVIRSATIVNLNFVPEKPNES